MKPNHVNLLVEEERIKIQQIKTKRFPFCFTKTGLKTNASPEEERCPKLSFVPKRYKEITIVEN